MSTIYWKPPRPIELGDYQLDAIVVEVGANELELDFRLQLGQGLGIYWALPAGRHDRLRLAHVDGAAYHLDEPELIADPYTCDLPAVTWSGQLATLGNGRTLVSATVEASTQPAGYCCELVTRRGNDDQLVTRLGWRPNDPWRTAPAGTRVTMLDQLVAELATGPSLELGAIARVCDEGGRLFDEGHLDGAQYAAVHALAEAARRAVPSEIRAALTRCRTWGPAPETRRSAGLIPGPLALGHRGMLARPAFAPDGHRYIAGDDTGVVAIHERRGDTYHAVAHVTVPAATPSSRPTVRGVAWSPSGTLVASHEGTHLRLRDARDLSELAHVSYVGNGPIAFGGGGTWIAALGSTGLTVLGSPVLEALGRVSVSVAVADAIAVDPHGELAIMADDGTTEETAMGMILDRGPTAIVGARAGTDHVTTIDPQGHVRGLVYDHWRSHVIANLFGGEIAVWTSTGASVRRFKLASGELRAIAITERWLVAMPDRPIGDAVLELWSLDGSECAASVPMPGGVGSDWVVASPDGITLLTRERQARAEPGIRSWTIAL